MTLIDVTKLNPLKTYVASEIGSSLISKVIQFGSHKIYPQYKPEEIASHTFALRCVNGVWHVWENHLKWNGIREYTLKEYEQNERTSDVVKVIVNEYPLSLTTMDYLLLYNPGYSALEDFAIAGERLIGLQLPETKGWVCSQSVAACNLQICVDIKKPFDEITPIDWQVYLEKRKETK